MPIFSVEGIQSRLFQVVGKMISYLIVHLDIGIPFLSPPVYQYIVHGSLEDAASSCSIKDICDFEIQELITKVQYDLDICYPTVHRFYVKSVLPLLLYFD